MLFVTEWGRKQNGDEGRFRRGFFAVGAILIVLGLAALSQGDAAPRGGSALRREEAAAAALIAGADSVPAETEEAPGSLNGKWNLWEYIGDALASLITGK